MSKKRMKKMTKSVDLDDALAMVNEGRTPHVNGSDQFAVKEFADPYDGEKRKKIIALRNDPLAMMHIRGTIDDVQLKAGRAYQADWHAAEIGGAKAIDMGKDKVDGGKLAEPDTDHRLKAHAELKRIHAALGEVGRDLVNLVLGLNFPVAQVAQMWGMMEHHAYRALRFRFGECLDTIAKKKGYAPERAAPGPRRKPDKHDDIAKFSENPVLHRAVLAARDLKRA